MSKLSYTGYSSRKKKEITVYSIDGNEQQLKEYEPKLKRQLRYFFKPDTWLIICECGNRSVRIDELELNDIFMKSKTSTKWHYCRHCNSRHRSKAMADLCFELDQKIMDSDKRRLIPVKK
jgi:hypothetical protein